MNQCPPQVPCYPKEFYQKILAFLCAINKNISGQTQGVRYDFQLLCDPNNGDAVFVRTAYNTDGTIPANNVEAFLPTGAPYTSGIIADLVPCSGGGSGPVGGPYRFDYEVLCNPVNGAPVLLQVPYNIDGNIYPYSAFNSDGSPYSGNIANLIACNAVAGGATRYDYEFLCDPDDGTPIFVRASYNINGTQNGFVAYNLDGSAYSGLITELVACGEGSGPTTFNGWSWQIMCDPTTGRSVFVRISYTTGGTPTAIDGWYGDLSEYTGDPYNLVDCASLGGGDGVLIWTPTADPSRLGANPGVGIQTVQRNLISTNLLSLNPLNYPIRCMKYNFQWKEIEPGPGAGGYVLTDVNRKLDDARAALQTLNLKILSYDPASGYTTPDYMFTNGGWEATDDGGPGTFKLCWWGAAANITALTNMMTAISAVANPHPAMNVLDCGWGDFDENNYDSSHYTGVSSGSPPIPVVGQPIPELTLAEAQDFYDAYRGAWTVNRLMVTHAAQQISFNYACGVKGMGVRMDGWGYRNTGGNPGGCPGGGVQMCTHAVNTFLPTGTYPTLYLTAPILMETYGRLYSGTDLTKVWLVQGWPWEDNFNWMWEDGGAHASEANVKGQFNPPLSPSDMRTSFETMLKHLGYRFVLLEMRRDNSVDAGSDLNVRLVISNVGTAPNYRTEVLSFRLYDPVTGYKFYYQTSIASSDWAPGSSNTITTTIPVPSWFPQSSAQLSVGLAVPGPVISGQVVPEIQFYNNGTNGNDWWYSFPTALSVVNASPSAAPDMIYAADFTFASSQFLSSTNTLFRLDATDFWIAFTVTEIDTSVNRGLVTKGSRATVATQEFWIGYNHATDRIEASWCNGTTIFTATANNFGDVSTKTIDADHPLRVLVEFNNTSKIMAVSVNNAVPDVQPVAGTGSIAAGSNVFRIGSDTNNNYMEGGITEVMIGKKLFTGLPVSFRQMLLDPVYTPFTDLPNQIKYGMYYCWEMTEASGNRVDSNCGRTLTSNGGGGGVQRVAVYP